MDVRYKYSVGVKDQSTGEVIRGIYRSRCANIADAISQLQKHGHQTVTSIKKVFVQRRAGYNF